MVMLKTVCQVKKSEIHAPGGVFLFAERQRLVIRGCPFSFELRFKEVCT